MGLSEWTSEPARASILGGSGKGAFDGLKGAAEEVITILVVSLARWRHKGGMIVIGREITGGRSGWRR